MRQFINIKKIVTIFGFLITFLFSFRILFIDHQDSLDALTQNTHEINMQVGSSWNVNPIDIDDRDPSRNWVYTEANYDWCRGSGTINDPYIIENVTIDGANSVSCLRVVYSSAHFIIRNCTLFNSGNSYDSHAGIKVSHSDNAQLINNTCFSNYYGIFTEWGDNYIISKNTVKDNIRAGIVLQSFHDNCIIKGNILVNNSQYGIIIGQESKNNLISQNFVKDHISSGILTQSRAAHNIIINNTVISNANSGIQIITGSTNNIITGNKLTDNLGYGIEIHESHENVIEENFIYNNTVYGIKFTTNNMANAMNNVVMNNDIKENSLGGIHLDEYSINNKIFLNNLNDNNINGYDSGTNNQWDDGYIGNFWDDYQGMDSNGDGIGDSPHDVTGIANSKDRFPILELYKVKPFILINSPIHNLYFGIKAPDFWIKINDRLLLRKIWYTIDYGKTNFTIAENIGHTIDIHSIIDQNAWNNAAKGAVVIIFYAKNAVGNIGINIITVFKIIPISGFNIILSIGITSVIIGVLVRKQKRK